MADQAEFNIFHRPLLQQSRGFLFTRTNKSSKIVDTREVVSTLYRGWLFCGLGILWKWSNRNGQKGGVACRIVIAKHRDAPRAVVHPVLVLRPTNIRPIPHTEIQHTPAINNISTERANCVAIRPSFLFHRPSWFNLILAVFWRIEILQRINLHKKYVEELTDIFNHIVKT